MTTLEAETWAETIDAYTALQELPPAEISSIVMSPEDYQKYTKEELIFFISSCGAQTENEASERFVKIAAVTAYADEKFAQSNKRQKRKTGEDTIFHALRMAYLLASNGITDISISEATILHDVHEDLGIELSEISDRFGEDVSRLVDLVTKVRMKKLGGKKKSDIPQEEADMPTLEKFLDSLKGDDYRAIYIKLADVADNSATYHEYDREKAKYKAGLALKYYEPLARKLGLYGFAQIIGDNAMKILNPKEYTEILHMREELNVEGMMHELNDTIAGWNDFHDDELNTDLTLVSLTVRLPGIYEIYLRAPKHKFSKEHILPRVEIVAPHWEEAIKWHVFLRQHFFAIEESLGHIDRLALGQSVTGRFSFYFLGQKESIFLTLAMVDSTIMPAQLDMEGYKLTDRQRNIAIERLQRLRDSYQEVSRKKRRAERMAENLGKEVRLSVQAPDGRVIEFAQDGVTVLDYAHRIGRDLASHAFGASIERDGTRITVQLFDILNDGDIIYIEADKKNGGKTSRVRPERLDWVVTEKARKDILNELNRLLHDPSVSGDVKKEIREAAGHRGVDVMKWLYEFSNKKHLPLDFSIEYGFDSTGGIEAVTAVKNAFLEKLGCIPLSIPRDEVQYTEALAWWEEVTRMSAFEKESSITAETQLLARDALRLADALVKYRESRPSLRIHFYEDVPGLFEMISGVIAKYGINMLPIHGRADLYAKSRASKIDICLIEGNVDKQTVKSLLEELKTLIKRKGSVEMLRS